MKKVLVLAVAICLSFVASASATSLTTVTINNTLNRPCWAGSTPALPNHLFVLERRGVIRVIDMANSNTMTTFMDISSLVHQPSTSGDEQGLLGLAFHPDYANNGFFYVYHTDTFSGASSFNYVARYTANPGLLTGDTASRLVMLQVSNLETNHNGGDMAFGPDGKLYIGIGDGGGGNDQHGTIGNAQSLTSATSSAGTNTWYLGKMLRMDVDIASPYVPSDNPNIGGSGQDLKWMYGLRNPFRWSWDRGTGDLYIGDVGQNAREEIDYIPAGTGAGRNFGWRCMEGNAATPSCGNCSASGGNCSASTDCASSPNLTCPIYVYNGTPLCVIGGYAYRGTVIPGEQGTYFYADYVQGSVSSFKVVGGAATGNVGRFSIGSVTSFGEDAKGEIYIVNGTGTTGGTVRRIVPSCNNKADINSDCAKDQADIDILVNVLLDISTGDPALDARCDINNDGFKDGADIGAWINTPFP